MLLTQSIVVDDLLLYSFDGGKCHTLIVTCTLFIYCSYGEVVNRSYGYKLYVLPYME